MGSINILYRIFGVASLTVALNYLLKTMDKESYAPAVNAAGITIVLLWLFTAIVDLLGTVETLFLRW